jgi:hypothetical protein
MAKWADVGIVAIRYHKTQKQMTPALVILDCGHTKTIVTDMTGEEIISGLENRKSFISVISSNEDLTRWKKSQDIRLI